MATNTVNQVITGFDASLMIDNVIVGRATEFSVDVKQNIEEIYEQGTRKAVEIKEKKFSVTGSVKRYYINQDMVKKAMGGTTYTNTIPYFTIQGYFRNASDGSVKTVTIQNAKFAGWKITAGLEANIDESMDFTALNIVIA
jgi:antitoxin component YwqK of YwqJK toxin-antitoxin module